MDKKDRSEYKYEIYLFSEPYFLYLEDESVIDANIIEGHGKEHSEIYGHIKSKNKFTLDYDDEFFDFNLKGSNRKKFSVIVNIFNTTGQFLNQLEFHGENLEIGISTLVLEYEQISNNNAWNSINPEFIKAADVYKSERVSYLRDKKINKILS